MHERQFLLAGPSLPETFASWQRAEIDAQLAIYAHPALDLTVRTRPGRRIVLVGYVLDPHRPSNGNADVVEGLLDAADDLENLVEGIRPLGGRWVMVSDLGDLRVVLHDAAGLRTVYHCMHEGRVFCATQPGLLRNLLHLPNCPDAEAFRRDTRAGRANRWPGDTALPQGVRRLLPNHYLDLATGRPVRYWPVRARAALDVHEAIDRCAETLQGTWRSAVHRFGRIAVPVTAGVDSRVLLAASREFQNDLYYFVVMHHGMDQSCPDVRVPRALAGRMGFDFHVLRHEEDRLRPLLPKYLAHSDLAREADLHMLYRRYPGWPKDLDKVATGAVGEVARCTYRRQVFRAGAKIMAVTLGMGGHRFAVDAFSRWLDAARPVCARFGYDVLDVLFWEQHSGGWAILAFAAADFDHETVAPYNSREYLETVLAVHRRHRWSSHRGFFPDLARRMWPESMSEPVNPPAVGGWTATLRRLLRAPLVLRTGHHLKAWATLG